MRGFLCRYFVQFLVVGLASSQSFVDDYCTHERTGAAGVCQLLKNCMPAIQELQSSGVYPQICGFQANEPIVCCPGGGGGPATPKPPTPTTTKTTTRTTTKTVTKATPKPPVSTTGPKNPVFLKVGDKAIQKCKEYGEYVNVVEQPPVNLPGAKPYVRSDCGITEVPLIVGGEVAKPKEFPHMALIGFQGESSSDKRWLCGGSLISSDYVLTAAHCLYNKEFGDPKYIRLGELDLNRKNDDADTQDFNVRSTFKHPQFKPPSQYNDIALIQMDRKANLNPYVRPICLNTDTRLRTKHAIASGWGKLGYTADVSNDLRKVTLEYFTTAECNNSYKSNIGSKLRYGIVPDTQVCAGSHDEAKDTCQGDSGGPLQVYNGDQVYCTYRLVGVTSFGKACGIVNIPGVYTLVSAYIEWIENQVWP